LRWGRGSGPGAKPGLENQKIPVSTIETLEPPPPGSFWTRGKKRGLRKSCLRKRNQIKLQLDSGQRKGRMTTCRKKSKSRCCQSVAGQRWNERRGGKKKKKEEEKGGATRRSGKKTRASFFQEKTSDARTRKNPKKGAEHYLRAMGRIGCDVIYQGRGEGRRRGKAISGRGEGVCSFRVMDEEDGAVGARRGRQVVWRATTGGVSDPARIGKGT